MRKLLLLLCLQQFVFAANVMSQSWQPLGPGDTNWPSAGQADFTSLAFNGSTPYVAYRDYSNGAKATVKMFNGTSWVDVGTPGFSAGQADWPSLAFTGSTPYVAYRDASNGAKATVKMFNGTSWVDVGTPGFSAGMVDYTSLAFNGSIPYVAYRDYSNGSKVTVKMFNGTSWVDVGTPGFSAGQADWPSLAFNGSTPYVAYRDAGNGYKATVKMFNGTSWVDVGTPGFSTGQADWPSLAFNSSTPYVAYRDASNGYKATVKMFNGTSWVDVGTPGFSAGMVDWPSLAFNGSIPYVAYRDYSNGSKVTVKMFNGTSWVDVGTPGFSAGQADWPSLAFNGSTPYVAYRDAGNGYKATVKMFNGTSWVDVGTPGFSAGGADYTSLAFNSSTPYVAYRDASNGYKATVKMFNGTSWVDVGTPGFSAGQADWPSLAFTGSTPYVAYRDGGNGFKATVKMFNGASWVDVGTPGFSAGQADYTSLTFTGSTPYVAYRDVSNGAKATVRMFNGTSWVDVGTPGFSAGQADYTSLAFNGSIPYVAYRDYSNGSKVTVKMFNGTSWVDVGTPGFSAGQADWPSLAFNGSIPYVAYRDGGNGYKATVKMFNGTSWVDVGTPGFSTGMVDYTSLAFNGSIPYVAYRDGGNGYKATVKMFNGTSWVDVGTPGFSAGQANYTQLKIANNNLLVVYSTGQAFAKYYDLAPSCNISVSAVVSQNGAGAVAPQDMVFSGAGQNVNVVWQGPGSRVTGGKTNIYSAINTTGYNGLWWTFYPIENPRHVSQNSNTSTGQMVFQDYNSSTGIMTFVSSANMTWNAASGMQSVATRMRVQLQPYSTGTHTGPITGSGWIGPVKAGDISLSLGTPANSNYPLIDVKALGGTAAYRVWNIIETASGIPLDEYYANSNPLNNSGSDVVTSFTGQFYSSALSTCQGGAATVTVSASGGTGPYTGTGTFQQLAGTHTYTVTDAIGCTGNGDATVVATNCVELSCVNDKVVNSDAGICTATVTGIDPVISPTGSQVNYVLSGATEGTGSGSVSGMSFNPGVTVVTYSSTDEPAKTCSFSVTVNDHQDPTILGLPLDITRSNDAGVCGAVVTWTAPEASDNCSGSSIEQTAGLAPGSTFPIGNTTITYKATDAAGNTHTESFTVTVNDKEDPTISGLPSDIVKANDPGVCGAVVTWPAPIAADNCPGSSIEQTAGLASGTTFPVGLTTITYTATDAAGNIYHESFTITVNDTEDPGINGLPANIIKSNDAGVCGAVVRWPEPIAVDNCTGSSIEQTAGPASGSIFPIGLSTVTYTATDASGNTHEASFTVTVNDTEDPGINGLPANIIKSNDAGVCGAVVRWPEPIAVDNCTGSSIEQTAGPASGSIFPIGLSTVIYTATDASGNTHVASFTITVNDTEDPGINGLPANIIKSNDAGVCGAVVTWAEPIAVDNCTGSSIEQTAGLPSGSIFPIGLNTVTYTATDAAGNIFHKSFTVTVNDTEDPFITQPADITASNETGLCTKSVNFSAGASDNCGVTSLKFYVNYNTPAPVEISSPRTFAVGSYLVTVVAKDAAGNQDVKSFTIYVNDDQDPTITAPAPILAQSSDAYQCGADRDHVALGTPTTYDNCHVKQVSNDAPSVFPVGTTTVTWTVEDDAGNTATATQDVTVIDDVNPTITVPHAIVSANTSDDGAGDCTVAIAIDNAAFDDNCTGEVLSWTFTGVTTGSGNGQVGTKTFNIGETVIHYTVTDAALNKAYATVTITVTDDEAPTITGTIPVSNIEGCSATAAPAPKSTVAGLETLGISISDNCTADAAMTVTSQDSYSGTCPLVITRTYTIKDATLNPVTVVHTINIDDNTNPQITCVTPPVGGFKRKTNAGSCAYTVVSTEIDATATDNCTTPSLTWVVTGATNASGSTTMAGQALNFGVNTITWTATDGCGNQNTCVTTVNVNEIQTATLVTVLPTSQKYSDKVTFRSTVIPYNCPVAGAIGGTVTFKIGSLTMGTATINATGVATLADVPLLEDMLYDADLNNPLNATSGPLKPGAKTVTAVFSATDADYIVANPTTPLQVDCEDVDVSYNGQQYFTVNPNNNTGTVSLSSYVVDRDDTPTGARGDVRNATITFKDGGASGSLLGTSNIPVGLINTGVTTEGIATTGFNYTLTNSDITNGGQVFDVWMGANNYYCGDAGETVPVTIALPGQDFVTGGGYIKMQNSAGTYAGTPTKRMNFGLVMRWNKSGKSLQGKVTIVYRRVVGGQSKVYQIKSNAINSLVVTNVNDAGAVATGTAITFRKAVISTKANLTDITNPLSPVTLGGSLDFVVTGWESTTNTTGALDRIGVQLSGSGSVGLLFSSNWSGGTTQWQKLDGGKMQVRSSSTTTSTLTRTIQASTSPIEITQFDLKVYPNPSHASFNIIMSSNNKLDKVQLRIMDISGRTIQVFNNLSANQTLQIGSSYRPGLYIVEMIQGNERKQLKLIKQPN